MATMTAEQIEQKKQLAEEVKAGAIELSEDELDEATGGVSYVKPTFGTSFKPETL